MIKTQFEYQGQVIRCELSETWTQSNWNIRVYDANGVGNLYGWGINKTTGKRYEGPKPYPWNHSKLVTKNQVLMAYKHLKELVNKPQDISAAAMTVLPAMQPRVVEEQPKLQPRTRTASGITDRF